MALTTFRILEKVEAEIRLPQMALDELQPGQPDFERGVVYIERPSVEGHSYEQALRKVGEKHGSGIYAAVAAARWHEEPVGAETFTRVKVG